MCFSSPQAPPVITQAAAAAVPLNTVKAAVRQSAKKKKKVDASDTAQTAMADALGIDIGAEYDGA